MYILNEIVLVIGKLVVGFVLGYIVASYVESYMHQNVSDANMKRVNKWKKHPKLFWYFIRTHYSHHVIHHVKTFKVNYVTQFGSEEEKIALDKLLILRSNHGEIIKKSNYATKLHGSGSLVFIAPLLPAIPLFGLTLLHMPHDQAIESAPQFISWLLKMEYFKAVSRNHFMHHRYMLGNFNLVLGGDVLRGVNRKPSEKDIQLMLDLGLPVT